MNKLRIKTIAKQKGLSIHDLAVMVGMLQPSLSRIINGTNTTTETLQKIADALGVNISELFDEPSNSSFNWKRYQYKQTKSGKMV